MCTGMEYCLDPATHTCASSCFAAGTPVTMADGSTRPIELIDVGDRVLGYDVETGATVAARVSHTFVHPGTTGSLLINGVLRTTPEHPFWVDGGWTPAAELVPGASLLAVSGASSVRSIESVSGALTTYNLEVDGVHNYFAGGVLVHNKPVMCMIEP